MLTTIFLIIYTTLVPNKWLIKWHKIRIGSRYVLREYADNPFERDNYTAYIGYIKEGYVSYYHLGSSLGSKDKSCSIEDFITSFKHTY